MGLRINTIGSLVKITGKNSLVFLFNFVKPCEDSGQFSKKKSMIVAFAVSYVTSYAQVTCITRGFDRCERLKK